MKFNRGYYATFWDIVIDKGACEQVISTRNRLFYPIEVKENYLSVYI